MALLTVENLEKRFGGLIAVNDISFKVESGEIFTIIGPHGAGKSTLFKLITSFTHPTSGRVIFESEDITRLPAHVVARKGVVARPARGSAALHPRARPAPLVQLLHLRPARPPAARART